MGDPDLFDFLLKTRQAVENGIYWYVGPPNNDGFYLPLGAINLLKAEEKWEEQPEFIFIPALRLAGVDEDVSDFIRTRFERQHPGFNYKPFLDVVYNPKVFQHNPNVYNMYMKDLIPMMPIRRQMQQWEQDA